jgi:3-oxoacid CoA-transferase B subunit
MKLIIQIPGATFPFDMTGRVTRIVGGDPANHVAPGIRVLLQSENGLLGTGPAPATGAADRDLFDAGGQPVTLLPGGACFDSALSFGLIRGGHVDVTVLGALEVDEEGSLASWCIPGRFTPGIGGAMDFVVGARRVIVAMEHVTRDGAPRFLRRCTLPLTARTEVDLLVTDLAVFRFDRGGPVLVELQPGVSLEQVSDRTAARFAVSGALRASTDGLARRGPSSEAA